MDDLIQDVRMGLRGLARKPGFATVAIVTLALGIGANVAIFSLVNAVLLSPLPVEDPERLVRLYTVDSSVDVPGFTMFPTSFRNYESVRDHGDVLESVAFSAPTRVVLDDTDVPRSISAYVTSASYFDVLGVSPAIGRTFSPGEDELGGAHTVAVLSHGLWESVFGSDPGVVGRTIRLNNEPYTVIGVAPSGFRGISTLVDANPIWLTASVYDRVLSGVRRDAFLNRRGLFLDVFGRLRAGASFEEASTGLESLGVSLAEEFPRDNRNRSIAVGLLADAAQGATPYRGADESGRTRYAGWVLMVVAGLVLLIACVNLANLLLAKGADRAKEMSIRAELGATPRRLAQQLMVESLVLALIGGGAGLGVAAWSRDLLWHLRPPQIAAGVIDVSIDGTVLAFTFALSLVTGLLFGIAPAITASASRDLNRSLKLGGRQGAGAAGRGGLRHALVAAEVALAFVAIVAAGLFVRSFQAGRAIHPGFDPAGLVSYQFDLGAAGYEPSRGLAFFDAVLESVRGTPGVRSAALSENPPVAITPFRAIVPEGEAEDPTRFGPAVTINTVSDGYFEALGIGLVSGRVIDATDREEQRPVSVVTRALAERFWPGADPVGRRFRFARSERYFEVVGVVEDAVVRNVLDEPQPVAYFALQQRYAPAVVMNIRAEGDPAAVVGAARAKMTALDPRIAVTDEREVEAALAEGLWASRVGASLLGSFGVLALVLASIGVYGVLAHVVSRRSQEVGIRLVFGATRLQIYALLMRRALTPAVLGLGLGVVIAAFLAKRTASLLYGVSPTDATTFVVTAVALFGASVLAAFASTRRAARLQPTAALRSDA